MADQDINTAPPTLQPPLQAYQSGLQPGAPVAAPTPVPAQQPLSGKTMPMFSPDGQVGDVPVERVPDAVKSGFKLGQDMYSPAVMGKPSSAGTIPIDRVHDALAAGFTLQSTEEPESDTGYGEGTGTAGQGGPVATAGAHVMIGVAKGAAETGHTVGRIINAATGDNIGQLPTSFQQPDYLRSDNGFETAGKVGEGVLEFVMGDGALKGLKLAEKMQIAQKLAKVVSDEPYAAKIVEAGLNAARMGLVSGVQTGLHEPNAGSIAAGTVAGFGGGVLGEGLGAVGDYLGTRTTKAAEDAAIAQVVSDMRAKLQLATNIGGLAKDASTDATGVSSKISQYGNFGDAADEIRAHFNPTYDELRKASGGTLIPGTTRYGANGFDDAVTQMQDAKKVIYSPSPASSQALTDARKSLLDGQAKLDAILGSNPKYAAAQAGWRKAATLDDFNDIVDKAYTDPAGVRQENLNLVNARAQLARSGPITNDILPQTDPKKFVLQVNKGLDKLGTDELRNALGQKGYESLLQVRSTLKANLMDSDFGKNVTQLTNQYLKGHGISDVNKFLGGTVLGGVPAIGAYLLGASNPITAGIFIGAEVLHFLYAHPDIGAPIVKAAAAMTPAAIQGMKQGITHSFNPATGKVELAKTPTTPTPPTTPETAPKQTFGQMDAERLVPAMASVEGGKPTDLNNRLNNPINLVYRGQSGATPYEHNGKVFASFRTKEEGRQAALAQLRLDQSRPEYADLSLEDYINQKHSPDSDPGNGPGQAKAYAAKVHALLGQ